jgi:hypothetical protein
MLQEGQSEKMVLDFRIGSHDQREFRPINLVLDLEGLKVKQNERCYAVAREPDVQVA